MSTTDVASMSAREFAGKWLRAVDRPEPWHDVRYVKTLCYIAELEAAGRVKLGRVLDAGGESTFTALLRAFRPGADVYASGAQDLRHWKRGNGTEAFDLVLCTEVIEHVHDLPATDIGPRDMWTSSGQLAALRNLRGWMHTESKLLITTPNACSLGVLMHCARGARPMSYAPHVRELTDGELKQLVTTAGLRVVEHGQWTVWNHHGLTHSQSERCKEAVRLLGGDPDRGDDLYLLAELS